MWTRLERCYFWQHTVYGRTRQVLTQECFEYQGLIARSIRQTGHLDTLKDNGGDWMRWARLEATGELFSLDGVC